MNTEQKEFSHRTGLAPETSRLIEKLKDGGARDVLTDTELGEICGRATGPGGSGYKNLLTAIWYCERHYCVTWQRVLKEEKIVCLGSREKVTSIDATERRLRHMSRRATVRLGGVDRADLSTDEQKRLDTRLGQMATVMLLTDSSTRKKLESKIQGQPEISRTKVLELFA